MKNKTENTSAMAELTPEERASRSAQTMWSNDQASKHIGIRMESVGVGTARFSMRVEPHLTNGHDICHGGYIFTLADTAFAFACNSYNKNTVAQQNSISFIAPGMLGDILTAEANEVMRYGRSGTYDVSVKNQNGETIALFRGNSRTIKGQLFEE